MLQQFKSMNDLVVYLDGLEERVKSLEAENQRLRSAPATTSNVDEHTIAKYVASFLPLTNLVHPSFLKRAFAVWGHFMVAHLIIMIPFMILYFCLIATLVSRIQGSGSYPSYP